MQDEEADAPESTTEVAVWPVWSGYLQHAWHALRDDRYFGSMGGMAGIYYTAISQYAKDHTIPIEPFATFIQAMDGVYMTHSAEKAAIERANNKQD